MDRFLGDAARTVAATMLLALLVGLLLLWLSSRLVTAPLHAAAARISRIDPDDPEHMHIPVPRRHRENELGHLLGHANEMLKRLASSQEELRQRATRAP